MWNDLVLAHEGPSDTKDPKIAALRLKFNAFKALEGEKSAACQSEEILKKCPLKMKGVTKVKEFMAIAEEEPSVGKNDARSDSGCSRYMTRVKQYLHKYSKESGTKVVFRDNSSGDTEGYGSVNCNRITFTRVAYVNVLKHNLISIS
ncbi:hypothetical protein Tco_1365135 [Tanacetum coccineum]